MNKQTEALRMAIEALDTLMIEKGSIYQQAIKACKEALEQLAPSWQGLSDDEREDAWYKLYPLDKNNLWDDMMIGKHLDKYACTIEQALKQKNTP